MFKQISAILSGSARRTAQEAEAERNRDAARKAIGRPQMTNEDVLLIQQNCILEESVLQLLDVMQANERYDHRWVAIARTHIEQATMAMNRAVTRPDRIKLKQS